MTGAASTPEAAQWWVALPDADRATLLAHRLIRTTGAATLVWHGSGRPWLVGVWPAHQFDVVEAGADRAAVFSVRGLGEPLRDELASGLGSTAGMDRLAALPGVDYVAVSRAKPPTRSRTGSPAGSTMEVRAPVVTPLLWTARRDGLVLLGSHARPLAADSHVEDAWCAGQLLAPVTPWAVNRMAPFAGVTAVAGGHAVTVHPGGRRASTRRWFRAGGSVSLDVAGQRLSAALHAEVAAHGDHGRGALAVAAGDLAATALLESAALLPDLAVRAVPRHVALTESVAAAGGVPQYVDDRPYDGYRQALSIGADCGALPLLDVPPSWGLSVGAALATARSARTWGASHLLSGYGSEAVLRAPLAYLRRLRTCPAEEEEHLAGWATALHVPVGRRYVRPVMRHILALDAEYLPYPEWIRGLARTLHHPLEPWLTTGWEPIPALPHWCTRRAGDLTVDLLRTAAEDAEPLAPDLVTHATLAAIRTVGVDASLYRDAALSAAGIGVSHPYVTAGAVAACLAVPAERRSVPGRLPLLTALPGMEAQARLMRTDHSHRHLVIGLLHNRAGSLRDLLCGGALAARGLVDPDDIDAAIDGVATTPTLVPMLNRTLVLEQWLRTKSP